MEQWARAEHQFAHTSIIMRANPAHLQVLHLQSRVTHLPHKSDVQVPPCWSVAETPGISHSDRNRAHKLQLKTLHATTRTLHSQMKQQQRQRRRCADVR